MSGAATDYPHHLLGQVAAAWGVEGAFEDGLGRWAVPSAETKGAILAAMGVDTGSEAGLLAALRTAEQQSALPPVVVIRAGEPASVPCGAADGAVSDWSLILEGGTRLEGVAADGRVEFGPLPPGYHRLFAGGATASIIAAPATCWLPPGVADGRRRRGLGVQLYLVRSPRNWGIGDFADLRELIAFASESGYDFVGLNPLHAMFLDRPEAASPYSPSSRLFLNALYIAVDEVPEAVETLAALGADPAFAVALARCRAAVLVDYAGVTDLKLRALRGAYVAFASSADERRQGDFAAFKAAAGDALHRFALFQSLRAHFATADWRDWPESFRHPDDPAIAAFAAANRADIDFYAWLQWIADVQLAAAAAAAGARGMDIGLYRDLAVGAARTGAETWATPDSFLGALQVGAPADFFNPSGQGWGLPPCNPHVLRADAYRDFIALLRANMRHAGGLRIDHVMGLKHLYCIPEGHPPGEGAFLSLPFEDFLAILALESHRNRCLVVGEDLGTVPPGFRDRMAAANILSYRVLFFEREGDGFRAPEHYPRLALAVAGSHDLPTLRGWWTGSDNAIRERLNLSGDAGMVERQRLARDAERRQVLRPFGLGDAVDAVTPDGFAAAAHAFLDRAATALTMVQLDDLLGETEPVNVPSTSDEYPNWRRRYARSIAEFAAEPRGM